MTFPFFSDLTAAAWMKKAVALALLVGGVLAGAQAPPPTAGAAEPKFTRTEDVVYGRKFGVALTLDVFQPERANGFGIIFVISGGWVSDHRAIDGGIFVMRPFLERGYTVFAVCHGCQPKFTIPEILEDMHKSVRFVRHHAARWGVDPNHLGVTGLSAGGHISLMLGTTGAAGPADAPDPIDRESSAVQCVACFFPPTDFLNYGKPGEDAVGVGVLNNFRAAFGAAADQPDTRQTLGKQISPIYFVTAATPPTLIIHGDADLLVPYQQAETFVARCTELKVPAQLVTRVGQAHGWPKIEDDTPLLLDWFDQHLLVPVP